MKLIRYVAAVAIASIAFCSCDDESMNIGNSLTDESDKLELSDMTFNAYTRTIIADSVLAMSTNCYFGRIKDPETGADVTSEFTSQFHVLENTYISPADKIVGRYDGLPAADSCDIILYISSPFLSSDSLTSMKMRVTELSRPMEEGQRYYSNLDPRRLGMLRENGISQSKMFTYRNLTDNDSVRSTSKYLDNIRIPLTKPYVANDGTTYNNYGTYIMRQYFNHPEYFRNSYAFIHNVCPGFFFEITDGFGFHAKVTDIGLRIFYSVQGDSTVNKAQLTLAGTKEVLQTTHVVNDQNVIASMAQEAGYTYIKSPAGLFTELTIPVDEIKSQAHANDSLVGAKMVLQRINNLSTDKRLLGIPSTLLLIEKDSLYSFFENSKVPNFKTSFYANYNDGASSSTPSGYVSNFNYYMFSNISNLITYLWETKQRGEHPDPDNPDKTDPYWTAKHPNWNKVVLVPITYTTSTSGGSITNIEHDMSLNSIRLVGGSGSGSDPVKISVVYARFK